MTHKKHSGSILVIASTFPRWQNDSVPAFVLHYCQAMQKQGYEVRALAPHFKGAAMSEVLEGVPVSRFRYWFNDEGETLTYEGVATSKIKKTPAYALKLIFYVLGMWWHAMRLTRRHEIDIINPHWLIPQGFVAILASMFVRRPVVVSIHGGDVYSLTGKVMVKFKRWTLRRASAVVPNSSATLEVAKSIYGRDDYSPIPMGIDVDRFAVRQPKQKQRQERLQILFVGRVSREKGLAYLCEAIKKAKNEGVKIHLTVAGTGPEETLIKQKVASLDIKDNVTFLGWVNHADLPELYSQADVFVGPSLILDNGWQEAFGLVFAESLASGTPVIATKTGGIRDIVIDGENGFLVPQKDAQAIADKLVVLNSNQALRRRMGRAGRRHIVDHFSWEAVAQKYAAAMKRLG